MENNYLYYDITPRKGIGQLKLGMHRSVVDSQVEFPYSIGTYPDYLTYESESITLWFSIDREELICISVEKNFSGKIFDEIGIGSTLTELNKRYSRELVYDAMNDEYSISGARFLFSPLDAFGEQYIELISIIK